MKSVNLTTYFQGLFFVWHTNGRTIVGMIIKGQNYQLLGFNDSRTNPFTTKARFVRPELKLASMLFDK